MTTPFGMPMGMMPKRRPTPPEKLGAFGEAYKKASAFRQKVAPYINNLIFYGWIPIVIYRGLQNGTHKFVGVTAQGPKPQSRKPRITDLLPLAGSHGLP